jgi:hypothetical protein
MQSTSRGSQDEEQMMVYAIVYVLLNFKFPSYALPPSLAN